LEVAIESTTGCRWRIEKGAGEFLRDVRIKSRCGRRKDVRGRDFECFTYM
jgi:hypothetical protein